MWDGYFYHGWFGYKWFEHGIAWGSSIPFEKQDPGFPEEVSSKICGFAAVRTQLMKWANILQSVRACTFLYSFYLTINLSSSYLFKLQLSYEEHERLLLINPRFFRSHSIFSIKCAFTFSEESLRAILMNRSTYQGCFFNIFPVKAA